MKYGARHLKRAIDRNLVHPLSNLIATGQVRGGDLIRVDYDDRMRRADVLQGSRGHAGLCHGADGGHVDRAAAGALAAGAVAEPPRRSIAKIATSASRTATMTVDAVRVTARPKSAGTFPFASAPSALTVSLCYNSGR